MNTHESYVSLETAKLLKQAGFDWEVNTLYQCYPEEEVKFVLDNFVFNYNIHSNVISAPTLAVAQRWLREVKGYYVAWEFNMNISSWGSELYDFANISVYIFVDSEQGNICKCRLKENYKTVEDAQEAGVKKALEIILEKGE